jgi:hypothetical protein
MNNMANIETNGELMEKIRIMTTEGKIDDVVNEIATYLNLSNEENYIERLENVLETVSSAQGGRTVIRFLIENLIIDIPTLLQNLSKRDSLLRYSFLLLLKDICENEEDLFLPYSEELLTSDDPNVREAFLQLLIFMAGGEKEIDEERLIEEIVAKLDDDKEFVVEKAGQALKAIGKKHPSLVTRILRDFSKRCTEDENLIKIIDNILKAIVTVEKIEEIVEEETIKVEPEKDLEAQEDLIKKEKTEKIEKEEEKILDKEIELKKKEIELKKKELELEEKEKELEIKEIITKEKELIDKEIENEISEKELPTNQKIKKQEDEILDKQIEIKKKELEIKKKKLEVEEKEKELEKKAIEDKEKALKIKEQLIEKEKELEKAEIELKKKNIEKKERKILDEEAKRTKERLEDDK